MVSADESSAVTPLPPTFFIVGAPRCGTTSLHYYLAGHPAVAMSSVKEPNYFLFDHRAGGRPLIDDERIRHKSVADRADYVRLFADPPPDGRAGEASPLYLYTREVAEQIAAEVPEARAIAVLRDPVLRAWSHFLSSYEGPPEAASRQFRDAVANELDDPSYTPYRTGTHYLRVGLYRGQVARYRSTLGPERVLVLLYDDLERDPDAVLRRIVDFLGLPPHVIDTSGRYNRSGVYGNPWARRVRHLLQRVQPYVKEVLPPKVAGVVGRMRARMVGRGAASPPLDNAVAAELRAWFAADVEGLAADLGVDLRHWTTPGR